MRISDWSSDVCSSDLRYPHAEPETAGGIEQIIAAIIIKAERQGPDKERPAARDGCCADRIALVGRQQFSSHRPRPGLLKNNIRLLLQTAGNLERPGVIGGPIDVAGGNLAVENLVTVQKIIAAVNGGERLFLCSHHPAEGHRAFRGEEVSMLPTRQI